MQPHSKIVFIEGIFKRFENLIIYTCMYMYVYMYIYTYTCMCMHAHTHIYALHIHAKIKYLHTLKFYHLIPFKQFPH